MVFRALNHLGEIGNYANSTYSQGGEDGIIAEIFKRMKIERGWFTELGASDGIYLSNTRALYDKGWGGVLIESDLTRYGNLVKNIDSLRINTFNAMVGLDHDNSLDHLLSQTKIPQNFDLLSLDVDGIDYWIWDSLEAYFPKVVIVEYNSNFSPNERKSVEYDPKLTFQNDSYYGASAGAFNELAKRKGYTLVGCVATLNLIFVNNEYMDLFSPLDINEVVKIPNFPQSQREMINV